MNSLKGTKPTARKETTMIFFVDNPIWRALRIANERRKIGFKIQRKKASIKNHNPGEVNSSAAAIRHTIYVIRFIPTMRKKYDFLFSVV